MLRASVSQQISSCFAHFAQSSSRSHFETGLFPFKRFGDENPDWSCDHSVNCGRIPPKCLQLTHLISMSHSTKTTLVEQASHGHHHAHSLFHCNSISVLWKLPERKLLFVWHSFGSNLVSPAHFVIQLMPRHLPRHVGKAICPWCQIYF